MILILEAAEERTELHDSTGIFIRAKMPNGKWGNADIAELTATSLLDWCHSRGECNRWAEHALLEVLGHPHTVFASLTHPGDNDYEQVGDPRD